MSDGVACVEVKEAGNQFGFQTAPHFGINAQMRQSVFVIKSPCRQRHYVAFIVIQNNGDRVYITL